MNKNLIKRIKLAGSYQKKALRALLPENVSGHLDVIENEMKMIFMEIAVDAFKKGILDGDDACKRTDETKGEQPSKGVRKIDLG